MSDNRNNTTAQAPVMRGGGPGPGMRGPLTVEKPKNSKKTLSRILKYMGASKYMLLALVILVVLTAISQLAGPIFQKQAIDSIAITEENTAYIFNTVP